MPKVSWKIQYLYGCLTNPRDWMSALRFLLRTDLPIRFATRLRYVAQIYSISARVWCAHTQQEILQVATSILETPRETEGVIVEAGCYKGGSTVKLSLVAKLVNRRLVVFDSFEGLPENDDSNQRSIFGDVPDFSRGKYSGALEEVKENVRRYGCEGQCTFIKGWFDKTMPHFSEAVVVGFLDVDLVSSTKTCLKYLFPRLQPGGSLFSQDGHLPRIIQLLETTSFWHDELGCNQPLIVGLGREKLVRIVNG
jgi:O-methyltransferase